MKWHVSDLFLFPLNKIQNEYNFEFLIKTFLYLKTLHVRIFYSVADPGFPKP